MLNHQKILIKKEAKKQIDANKDEERLVLLKFTELEKKEKLHWEHSAEFEYQHQMYDVVKSEVHGDTTYYWCWHDIEETKINEQLNELFCLSFNYQNSRDGLLQKFQNLWKSFYHSKTENLVKNIPNQNQGKWNYTPTFEPMASLDPVTPPPKIG